VTDHTVKAYDRELKALADAIRDTGGLVRHMVVDALESIAAADVARALDVVAMSARVASLQRQIESDAMLTIARRAPVADDLREVVSAIRIAGDLGRVGAHAQEIARRTVKTASMTRAPRAIVGLRHMGALADELLKDALDAYAARDAERARSAWMRDADLDSLEGSVFSDLLNEMIEDPRAISFCANVMSVSKAIERIGDHATNIAETVMYLITGVTVEDDRPRGRGMASLDPVVAADDF
jgi:phosphate transport system protein